MALVACVVLVVFVGKLVQLQVVQAGATAEAAFDQRARKLVLHAQRGDIVDRNGAVLATTVERRHITVDQRIVGEYGRSDPALPLSGTGVRGAAARLAPILGMPERTVRVALTGSRPFVYLKKDVEPTVWRQVSALEIPGVLSEQADRRTYPADQVAASVIGFLSNDGAPMIGVEKVMDEQLQGRDGVLRYERGAGGQQIATGDTVRQPPVPGRTVQLTLDRDLQWKAQQELCAAVRQTRAASGQAVVMDPRNGELLALAECPTFDANAPGDAALGDLQNRVLSYMFEPGSTSKVITAAAAMEEGLVRPGTRLEVDDSIRRGGETFNDSHSHPRQKLTFAGILAQSSNTGTIRIGERVPPGQMYDYMRAFGLGQPSGVELPEADGLLAPASEWSASQRYTVLFGQGVSVTAVQSAAVFATLANDGVRVQPSLIKAVTGAEGELVPYREPARTRAVSAETAASLRLMLESVVGDDGTAIRASVPGYRVAGKTGTAQAYSEACGCYDGTYTASFVGMAPADDPRLVVAVFLQKPTNGYYGGTVAAPVFQKVMTYALANRGVEPTGRKAPKLPVTWD